MKVLLTGGHLSPLLAVIDALPKNAEILVIGRKHALEGDKSTSLESQVLKENGVEFRHITTGRLQRNFSLKTIFSLAKFPQGILQSFGIVSSFKPEVIVSFGGYVSLSVVLAGKFLNTPIVIHEQTLEAGLANKIASRFAKKICISWESSRKFFPNSKVVLTGNPIRKHQISNIKFQLSSESLPLIYITGGSLGSHAINILVEGCLEKLLSSYRIFHQTGDAREFQDFDRLEEKRNYLDVQKKERYYIAKFVKPQDIGAIIKKADIVVSRAGMNTITELIYFKKPAILIPLPFSQGDEQKKNAQFFKNLGLGEVLDQNQLTSDDLYTEIVKLLEKKENYKTAYSLQEDAAEKIVHEVLQIVQKK